MVGKLLARGMLVGIVAGLLAFAFLKVAGEPSVERAIAFESRMEAAKGADHAEATAPAGMAMPAAEPELVSRPVQAGLGLFTGVVVYGAAFGGLFALVFAAAYGRMAAVGPRATSALLALIGFVAVYLLPCLKYPANPPSVGEADTIGMRTALYFAVIAISLAAAVAAAMLRKRLVARHGPWNAALIAVAAYGLFMAVAAFLLPSIDEVPEQFPAVVLWQFRIASLGAQVIMWTAIGLLFGALTERAAALGGRQVLRTVAP